jgi:hypothetical protein
VEQDLFQLFRGFAVKNETVGESPKFLNLEGVVASFKIWEVWGRHLIEDPENERLQPDNRQIEKISQNGAHHTVTRLATSKYLVEAFGPLFVNANSKISRSNSGGKCGERSVWKDIFGDDETTQG